MHQLIHAIPQPPVGHCAALCQLHAARLLAQARNDIPQQLQGAHIEALQLLLNAEVPQLCAEHAWDVLQGRGRG